MEFQGAGDNSVHITQLHVTASLLRSGVPVEDVVAEVLEATRRAVANDPTWDWDDEKLTIERMCYDFVSKNPELAASAAR
jgi:putative DNA primase/helicase